MAKVKSNLFNVWKRREMQKGHSLTYKHVAKETGVNTATLYNYRKGTVRRFEADTLEALCTFFECDPCEILIAVPDTESS